MASVDVAVKGPLQDALWVLDREPLGYASEVGVTPEDVAGVAGARLRFEIPLLADLKVDDVKIGATANMTGVSIPGAVAGIDLTEADLTLDLSGIGMTLTGTGTLMGEPAEVRMERRFIEAPGLSSSISNASRC